jgi:hypothetical protein
MRRALVCCLLLIASLGSTAPALAGASCHPIRATGEGQGAPPQAGDPPNLVRTVAQIRGGGLLQGATAAAFVLTGPTATGVAIAGDITFTTNRGTLTLAHEGPHDLGTGAFQASGDAVGATGKLAGAMGSLTLAGVQDLTDPAGAFTETVVGTICVDLGGNGRE